MINPHQTILVNSRKYDGTIHHTWKADLIGQKETMIVLAGEFVEEIRHSKLGVIRRGTISYEYYWLDRWYNIFRFHNPEGDLRNYYCNICMPAEFKDGVLDYVDLEIDLLISNDFKTEILDSDEFELNAVKFEYPSEIKEKVRQTTQTLLNVISNREFPFFLVNDCQTD